MSHQVTLPKIALPELCPHGMKRGLCLSFECSPHPNIPVRGEALWDSTLKSPRGTSFLSPGPWTFQFQTDQTWILPMSQFSIPLWSLNGSFLQSVPTKTRKRRAPKEIQRDMPVIGFRAWNVGARSTLRSLNDGIPWPKKKAIHAKCLVEEKHKIPTWDCHCGVHVLAHLKDVPLWGESDSVAGAVIGWGHVIRHGDEGWRAEYARPIGLLDTRVYDESADLERLGESYGIPILGRQGLQLLAKEYGAAL